MPDQHGPQDPQSSRARAIPPELMSRVRECAHKLLLFPREATRIKQQLYQEMEALFGREGADLASWILSIGQSREERPVALTENARQQHVVISLHGIRTRGEWQKRFAPELAEAGFIPEPLDYGFFGSMKLLNPLSRRRQVDWFRDEYTRVRQRFPTATISIVAHSMGTYLVARAMEIYKEIEFNRVIFCGAIVRRDYPWSGILSRSQFIRVLNDYGSMDIWARIVQWVVEDAGQSGLRGFQDEATGRVVQRLHSEFRHSDYFYTLNYRNNWIPFLLGTDPPENAPLLPRPHNWKFIITLAVLAVVIIATIYLLWR